MAFPVEVRSSAMTVLLNNKYMSASVEEIGLALVSA